MSWFCYGCREFRNNFEYPDVPEDEEPLCFRCRGIADVEPPALADMEGHIPVFFGYVRVSTYKQELSPEAQSERIKAYYEYMVKTMPALRWGGIFIEAPGSAFKKFFAERKIARVLLERVKPGDHICFTRLDRGFRRASDAINTMDDWRAREITCHMLDFGIDTSKPASRMILGVIACMAEYERELARERTMAVAENRYGRREDGTVACKIRHGEKWVKTKAGKKIVECPTEMAVMGKIFEMSKSGMSGAQIYWALRKAGIKDRDGREWTCRTILRCVDRWCTMHKLPYPRPRSKKGKKNGTKRALGRRGE